MEIARNIKDGSAITGAANIRLLAYAKQGAGWTSNIWGTYKHLREQGYQVNKGEKGTALFVPQFKKKNEKEEVPEEPTRFICVHFFNLDQTAPIDDLLLQKAEKEHHQE